MTVTNFQGTDTLPIEFKASAAAETRDLDENTQLEIEQIFLYFRLSRLPPKTGQDQVPLHISRTMATRSRAGH
jgi:hypothetical protein